MPRKTLLGPVLENRRLSNPNPETTHLRTGNSATGSRRRTACFVELNEKLETVNSQIDALDKLLGVLQSGGQPL
jgi:hypothetical protein